jgi:hypothetical protein
MSFQKPAHCGLLASSNRCGAPDCGLIRSRRIRIDTHEPVSTEGFGPYGSAWGATAVRSGDHRSEDLLLHTARRDDVSGGARGHQLSGAGVSFELLERASQALEPVLSDVVFLGGASIVLWITDPAASAPRPTKDVDVDVVVGVISRAAFHAFEERLRSQGFKEDQEDGIICRWRHREDASHTQAGPLLSVACTHQVAGGYQRQGDPGAEDE